MLKLEGKCTIGIDLAGLSKNPTGFALLKGKTAKTSLIYTGKEILDNIIRNSPPLIAIDAPLSLPKKGEAFRRADREMIKKGLPRISSNTSSNESSHLTSNKIE